MLNSVRLIGRLGKHPELKQANGKAVCRMNIATTEKWSDNGETKERTDWHNVVVWGKLAEICAKYLDKGRLVFVDGKIQTRSYDKDGQKHWVTEVIAKDVRFLDSENRPKNHAPGASNEFEDFGF